MPRKYSTEIRRQAVSLARSGTPVAQLKTTFGIGSSTIYNWLTQEKIDRGEIEGVTGQGIDVSRACLTLGVTRSGYYEWKKGPTSARALRHVWLQAEIKRHP